MKKAKGEMLVGVTLFLISFFLLWGGLSNPNPSLPPDPFFEVSLMFSGVMGAFLLFVALAVLITSVETLQRERRTRDASHYSTKTSDE